MDLALRSTWPCGHSQEWFWTSHSFTGNRHNREGVGQGHVDHVSPGFQFRVSYTVSQNNLMTTLFR